MFNNLINIVCIKLNFKKCIYIRLSYEYKPITVSRVWIIIIEILNMETTKHIFPVKGYGLIQLKKKNSKICTRIFLTESPTNLNIGETTKFLQKNNITHIFCFTHQKYSTHDIGATIYNFEFKDGSTPDKSAYNILLDDFENTFIRLYNMTELSDNLTKNKNEKQLNVMFHCDSGYGRAPTMLAYLMIKYYNLNNLATIDQIRKVRRGSFNAKQLTWISNLKNVKKNNLCCIL